MVLAEALSWSPTLLRYCKTYGRLRVWTDINSSTHPDSIGSDELLHRTKLTSEHCLHGEWPQRSMVSAKTDPQLSTAHLHSTLDAAQLG